MADDTLAPFDTEKEARYWCAMVLSSAAPTHVHNNCINYFRKAIRAAYEAGRTPPAPAAPVDERERLAQWCEAQAEKEAWRPGWSRDYRRIAALLRLPREREAVRVAAQSVVDVYLNAPPSVSFGRFMTEAIQRLEDALTAAPSFPSKETTADG